MGCKSIPYYLSERGITMRGQRWLRPRVHEVLANPAYIGDYYFNRVEGKTRRLKPQSERVKLTASGPKAAASIDSQRMEQNPHHFI